MSPTVIFALALVVPLPTPEVDVGSECWVVVDPKVDVDPAGCVAVVVTARLSAGLRQAMLGVYLGS